MSDSPPGEVVSAPASPDQSRQEDGMQRARLPDADDLHRAPIRAYVHMLAGEATDGELLELRFRLPQGRMAQRFFPARTPAGLVEAAMRLGRRADVYVGCALRNR